MRESRDSEMRLVCHGRQQWGLGAVIFADLICHGPLVPDAYTMSDIGIAAFSIFFLGSPSSLAHRTALAAGQGRPNCQTLSGTTKIPAGKYNCLMPSGAAPAVFYSLLGQVIAAAGPMESFQRPGGRRLFALDGTEYFSSHKIPCAQCLTRKRSDGGTE